MMNQSAQGLASLGRGNDSMLVHMTPREVEGLQGLAMAHGGSLTINPQTGLPEAGFLDAVLPMAAGFALGPGGFGLFSGANAALMAGLTVGGLTALTSGDLGKGLMAGFGAYGGSGLGEAIKGFGSQAAKAGAGTTGEFVGDALAANKINVMNPSGAPGVNVFSGAGAPGVNLPKFAGAQGFGPSAVGNTSFLAGNAGAEAINPKNLLDLGSGAGTTSATNLIRPGASSMPLTDQSLSQGFSNVLSDPSGFAKEYGPGKLALQGGSLALQALNPEIKPEPFYVDPEKGKYRSSTGGLSLNDKFDSGLRLVAEGGYIDGYATGGTIQSGGIRDLYGTPDNQPTISPGLSGFGLGRLNNLAGERAITQAQTLGYAEGGEVSNYGQNQAALNLDELPTLNLNTGMQSYGGSSEDYINPIQLYNAPMGKEIMKAQYALARTGSGKNPLKMTGSDASSTMNMLVKSPALREMAGIGSLTSSGFSPFGFAKGGYLDGAGDGMSDSIPATIEGKQPARLADGEFVVPADVVSHIGNGSSKAGSKRLYAMMDKVRHARTGNKKQGKQIKPEKYMPA